MQRWRPSALDQKPKHERNLPEEGGLRVGIHLVLVLRQQYARKAQDHPGEAGDGEPHAQEPRKKSRPIYKQPERKELFTSEGCSICPPADALLERLDRSQPVSGAELIVLSKHVDYWNDIGWKDPYSSHEYSERQSVYAAQFGRGSIYTPQMVVDGHFELVGSDERRAKQAIENAAKAMKTPVSISFGLSDEKAAILHIETGPLPSPVTAEPASVFLAIADNSDESQVSRGEDAGRTLKHVAVLRNLIRIGAVDRTTGFSRNVKLDLNAKNPRNLRIAVILQEEAARRVWGAGLARLTNWGRLFLVSNAPWS